MNNILVSYIVYLIDHQALRVELERSDVECYHNTYHVEFFFFQGRWVHPAPLSLYSTHFDLWKAFMIAGSVLFAFADTPEKYWSHILPGMIVGTLGLAVSYVAANIAIITGARPGQEASLSDSETLLVIVAELSFRSLGCGGCCYEHCFSDGCDDWHSWYVKKYYISSINYFHLE